MSPGMDESRATQEQLPREARLPYLLVFHYQAFDAIVGQLTAHFIRLPGATDRADTNPVPGCTIDRNRLYARCDAQKRQPRFQLFGVRLFAK